MAQLFSFGRKKPRTIPANYDQMKVTIYSMLAFMFASVAFALDYLEPDIRIESPDKHWVVWVVKQHDKDDYTAQLFISATNSSNSVVLAENDRHFGCEWSPESKVLLIYDNCGSGTSDTIIYRYTPDCWRKIYQTPGGFHIIWRLDEWLPDGDLTPEVGHFKSIV